VCTYSITNIEEQHHVDSTTGSVDVPVPVPCRFGSHNTGFKPIATMENVILELSKLIPGVVDKKIPEWL
jgi:hypothetical protein